jgi:hypothetical protein
MPRTVRSHALERLISMTPALRVALELALEQRLPLCIM